MCGEGLGQLGFILSGLCGAPWEGQWCVPDVCLCVAASLNCRDPWGAGGLQILLLQAHRVRSQKHGWLPTQPERQGSMSDCGKLPVCCAEASARGGRLRCAWLGQGGPGAWPLAAGNLGGGAPSLHVAAQPHPASLPLHPKT